MGKQSTTKNEWFCKQTTLRPGDKPHWIQQDLFPSKCAQDQATGFILDEDEDKEVKNKGFGTKERFIIHRSLGSAHFSLHLFHRMLFYHLSTFLYSGTLCFIRRA